MHHGIDCGDGNVIHYTGEVLEVLRANNAKIEISSMVNFLDGGKLKIEEYTVCSPVADIMDRAYSRLNEQSYSLTFNNCEHFARWCKTGRQFCTQLSSVDPILSHIRKKLKIDAKKSIKFAEERADKIGKNRQIYEKEKSRIRWIEKYRKDAISKGGWFEICSKCNQKLKLPLDKIEKKLTIRCSSCGNSWTWDPL
jgi:hypothetical protein